ncbi:hypothetical protein PHSC3_000298 [Chlamydiales bacterium STE3]|nr:hypothetical protein PHSC3_000298 [Chlamydiales bacterium STE3]
MHVSLFRTLILITITPLLLVLTNYNAEADLIGKLYFSMPEIWVCERCGFRNYEGIDKCPVCGTFRWQDEE